ncbi:MAG: glycosyltransferase, partial [Terrimicrobiaceae bacterium]|nr:glycosyltransferase [Terrimicrobiaceae bacterium]
MKIAFVYAGGREARLEAARLGNAPTDFFYGAIEMERDGHVIQVHDLPAVPSKFSRYLNRFVRRWLPPKTQVPDIFAAGKLLHLLQDCDAVIATTSGTAFALGIWKKLGKLPARLIGIHCGIVNCRHDLPRAKSAAAILKAMTPVLFADNEASEMENQFGGPKPASVWFGVDEEYWNPGPVVRTRNGVLAVGNDGRRDYETLLKTATLLPEVSFKIVTRISLGQDLPPNVKHLHGDWSTDAVSDETLREFYRSAACVAVPLHESIQPSGQSVAMQAMMCGAPVVMTRTPGWWGAEVLRSGEHLLEVPPKNP